MLFLYSFQGSWLISLWKYSTVLDKMPYESACSIKQVTAGVQALILCCIYIKTSHEKVTYTHHQNRDSMIKVTEESLIRHDIALHTVD